ncbi:hypothetical protein SKAU_G00367150 [Synaphobranchus kaupii]|uniref:Uncharacterized protein n=1 Tax=Synaphobranchus kaupii TaxID=118154 RepID=A0A9Q1EFB6_SYNKA|nr:hypothetical protein SKAU_G00367150 [Synaphobranchus kaupii]
MGGRERGSIPFTDKKRWKGILASTEIWTLLPGTTGWCRKRQFSVGGTDLGTSDLPSTYLLCLGLWDVMGLSNTPPECARGHGQTRSLRLILVRLHSHPLDGDIAASPTAHDGGN